MGIVIFHNPACGTSRNTLALIRAAGVEPQVVEYLKTPPSREEVASLAARIGLPLRDLLRRKGTPYAELGLDDPALDDAALLDAISSHPILLNRPIVVTPAGVKLCRPSDAVLDLLPPLPASRLEKEEGAPVLKDVRIPADDAGLRAALMAEGLPVDDLHAPELTLFAYDTLDGTRVGYGGFELHGNDALLRSIVVPAEARGGGIGRNLVPLLALRAFEAGARRGFLLTEGAAAFFAKVGFKPIERSAAPSTILATRQASSLCPATATLMTRTLGF